MDGTQGAISQVRPGMKVVDREGKEIGTVEFVKMGDPGAATTRGQEADAGDGPLDMVTRLFRDAEPDVPPAVAARLLRTGFLKVDARGLFARDFYVGPERVGRVERDTVHLSTDTEGIARET